MECSLGKQRCEGYYCIVCRVPFCARLFRPLWLHIFPIYNKPFYMKGLKLRVRINTGIRARSMSHIAVERNRRRQMNDHLKVLRSLTPCFYIKKGDQASIIGGVVEFIKELHQVLQSLESQKRRKSLSPSPGLSPRQLQPSPRQLANGNIITNHSFQFDGAKELVASCNSPVADVEAKISGSNVVLRVMSKRIRGQLLKIIGVLEKLSFEILHLNISSMDDTVLYYIVIKIGLECQLSMEELAIEVQRCFCNLNSVNSTNEI